MKLDQHMREGLTSGEDGLHERTMMKVILLFVLLLEESLLPCRVASSRIWIGNRMMTVIDNTEV